LEIGMYRFYMRLALIVVAIVVGVSIFLELYMLPVVVVPLVILGAYVLRGRVRGVVQDERNFRISEVASRRTIQLLGATTGFGGVFLVAISQFDLDSLEPVGFTMAMFASALLLCYLAFYGYYRRKLGDFSNAE
jgi:uncharacterized membrane protein